MSQLTRRSFLQGTLAAAATVTIAGTKSSGKVRGANDTIRVAVAGLNGRGGAHVDGLAGLPGVQVVALIDPDTRTYDKRIKQVQAKGKNTPKTYQDIRKALEDKDINVVTIATPNHWHSLMTIWSCQAGKDVYVEEPCSHNVHEGRIAVETARKHNRIVQHGTQSRSGSEGLRIQALVKSGMFGKLLISRGLCYKDGLGKDGKPSHSTRGDIGFKEQKNPPAEIDFSLWLGPAQTQPYHENLVHYRWHWFWDFGNGDLGNQGVHEMDKARWAITGATLPKSVISFGGRLGHKDQGQTASSQVVLMDFGETQLIFEVRGLPSKPYLGEKVGNTYHFEAGTVAGSKFYPRGKDTAEPLPKIPGDFKRGPGGDHFGNFIAAVRSRHIEDLNADILEGHYSSALCHLGNMSLRLGEQVPFNPRTRTFGDNKDASDALERMEEYLAKDNGLKLDAQKYLLGRKLVIDPKAESILGDAEANRLLTREYRKPFVVPEKV